MVQLSALRKAETQQEERREQQEWWKRLALG